MTDEDDSKPDPLLTEWGKEQARLERRKRFVAGVVARHDAFIAAESEQRSADEPDPATNAPPALSAAEASPRLHVISGEREDEPPRARAHQRRGPPAWLWKAGLPLAAAAGLAVFLYVRFTRPTETTLQPASKGFVVRDPAAPLERTSFVALLDRELGASMPRVDARRTYVLSVSDLAPDDPARAWIARGVFATEGGRFEPERQVTRVELVMSLYYSLDILLAGNVPRPPAAGGPSYTDVPADHFARNAIAALVPNVVPPRSATEFGGADVVSMGIAERAIQSAQRFVQTERGSHPG